MSLPSDVLNYPGLKITEGDLTLIFAENGEPEGGDPKWEVHILEVYRRDNGFEIPLGSNVTAISIYQSAEACQQALEVFLHDVKIALVDGTLVETLAEIPFQEMVDIEDHYAVMKAAAKV